MRKRFAVFALAAMMLTGCAAGEPTPDPLEITAPVVVPEPEPAPAPEPAYVPPAPEPEPAPEPVYVPPAPQAVSYKNCTEVKAAGAAPIQVGDPGWDSKFDKDGDGVGCEK